MHKSRYPTDRSRRAAQVEQGQDRCMNISTIVLSGSITRQRVFPFLSIEEQEWIADEVNLILECINLNAPVNL